MPSIENWLKEKQITEVECLIPDITGNARGKFIPADKFIKEDSRLPEGILIQAVNGEYSDDYWEIIGSPDGDMVLEPDASSIRVVPWALEPTAQIIHDCFTLDGKPHPLASRNVLKRILGKFEELGLKPVVAPEMEFYLVAKNTNPDQELKPPIGRSGRREKARMSYSIDAVSEFEELIEKMYDFCDEQELDVDTLIHETGAAQMEINMLHGDALELADQVFIFKRTMRETAMGFDMYATFMAKPMQHEPGSAMHIHQSLLDTQTGKNVFAKGDDEYSELFFNYLGGLQKYMPFAMAFMAPNVNSYRRFSPEIAAPINMHWGYDNRTCGLRVPNSTAAGRRIENRFPGADCNPYLAMAASLACGYLGIVEELQPSEPFEGVAYEDADITLPRSLIHALDKLDKCEPLKDILGKEFVRAFHSVKSLEFEEFNQVISSWERDYLLLNV
jgi:glutamine synthetase